MNEHPPGVLDLRARIDWRMTMPIDNENGPPRPPPGNRTPLALAGYLISASAVLAVIALALVE